MATVSNSILLNDYPTSDGKPMAETDWHRHLMMTLIQSLEFWYNLNPMVYVSGNLLIFYVPGNKRRHISPDVFVVKGVAKRQRPNYLVWEEGKSPDVIIELTSSSTHKEDLDKKFKIYQNILKVREYFLFDPLEDYLDPPLQGFRLQKGKFTPIRPIQGRMPSKVLGLHLEPHEKDLRLYNPATDQRIPTPHEQALEAEALRNQAEAMLAQEGSRRIQAEALRVQAEAMLAQAETQRDQERQARLAVEAELERLRNQPR